MTISAKTLTVTYKNFRIRIFKLKYIVIEGIFATVFLLLCSHGSCLETVESPKHNLVPA